MTSYHQKLDHLNLAIEQLEQATRCLHLGEQQAQLDKAEKQQIYYSFEHLECRMDAIKQRETWEDQ